MTRPRLTLVDSPRQDGTGADALSFGVCSGSRFDPHAYRRAFPDRWAAFLRAHHRSPTEVAYFYGVTDRAARDWWDGVSAPRGSAVAQAHAVFPDAGDWLTGKAA